MFECEDLEKCSQLKKQLHIYVYVAYICCMYMYISSIYVYATSSGTKVRLHSYANHFLKIQDSDLNFDDR